MKFVNHHHHHRLFLLEQKLIFAQIQPMSNYWLNQNKNPVTREQGERAAKEYGAYIYIECSALTQENLKETFDAAILASLTPLPSKHVGVLCCCS